MFILVKKDNGESVAFPTRMTSKEIEEFASFLGRMGFIGAYDSIEPGYGMSSDRLEAAKLAFDASCAHFSSCRCHSYRELLRLDIEELQNASDDALSKKESK